MRNVNAIKNELYDIQRILEDKNLSNKERYPLLYKLADKCPKFAGLLKEEEEYCKKIGFYKLSENERVNTFIADPVFNELELKMGHAIIDCWSKFDEGDFKHEFKPD